MALTLRVEQRLDRVGLIQVFEDSRERWKGLAERSWVYATQNFPEGTTVRRDDVKEFLTPLLEVDKPLTGYLTGKKLREKYWASYFADLIIDRCWAEITEEEEA